jgi:hypothetical protein
MLFIKGICSDHTAIVPVGTDYPDLYMQGNEIIYRSYRSTDTIAILDLQGRMLYKNQCSGQWESFIVDYPGTYIINLNNRSRKIVVYNLR